MFERDYIVRLLMQSSLMLNRLTGLRKEERAREALEESEMFLRKELRLNSALALGIGDSDLISMYSGVGVTSKESLAVIAAFLHKEGDLLLDLGEAEASAARYGKAFRLNVYLLLGEMDVEGWDLGGAAAELLDKLDGSELDAATKRSLWGWQEWNGSFAEAENTLYELADDEVAGYEEGEAFYERLAALDDGKLEAGGLPRAELEDGRVQWAGLRKTAQVGD